MSAPLLEEGPRGLTPIERAREVERIMSEWRYGRADAAKTLAALDRVVPDEKPLEHLRPSVRKLRRLAGR